MGKITGFESSEELPDKVRMMYQSVLTLISEGTDLSDIRVSTVTQRAGIGKGTAYEYFDSKEEIVACAIVHHLRTIFAKLIMEMEQKNSFLDQMDYLFSEMDKKDSGSTCFLRLIHLLTDNSSSCKLVQSKTREDDFLPYLPTTVFGNVLRKAIERGELREDLPLEYMVFSLFSHLGTYLIASSTEGCFQEDVSKIKEFVYQGILNELCKKNI